MLRIAAILLIISVAFSAYSQEETRVFGTVLDPGGEPVPGAVIIVSEDAGKYNTQSDINGLYSLEVPDEGGITEFVSCRAAYNRLSDQDKEKIDPLVAIHDYVYSRSKVSPDAVTPSHAASLPPVKQKLVRQNPGNGDKNIYIGSHAKEIDGWGYDESRALLDGLLEEATGRDHVYGHQWQVGDFVIWDNRCLIHRGAGYDADKYRRRIRQTRVTGEGNTLVE